MALRRGMPGKWENISIKILQLNQQLRSLKLALGSDPAVLQCLSDMHNLESLDFWWEANYFVALRGGPFHFKNVKKINMWSMCTSPFWAPLPIIPFSFDGLIDCDFFLSFAHNEECYQFLARNPSITILRLSLICRRRKFAENCERIAITCRYIGPELPHNR